MSILIGMIVAGILSARLWCYRRQISHMKEELQGLVEDETNRKLTSYCSVGDTEQVIYLMNQLITKQKELEIHLKNENRIYKESIISISHDIRTPLTSGKGYLQMLRKENLPEEKRLNYLAIVEKRLDHLTDMLNQLFEYTRIEAGEMKLEPAMINAGNLFTEIIFMFYEDFRNRSCEPTIEFTQTPCIVWADKHAFTRILENLIKNALVHGSGGYCFSLTEEMGKCVIRISNLTETVEAQDIDIVFDRFYTTDQSRAKKTTGFGLAIVKRFAEQMGGEAKAFLDGKRFTIEVTIPKYEKKFL